MQVKDILSEMLSDVKNHNRDKSTLLTYYIQERLQKSLKSYYKILAESLEGLNTYTNEKKILKQLVKKK